MRMIVSNRIPGTLSCIVFALTFGLSSNQVVSAQQLATRAQESKVGHFKCSQPGFEQDALIREAERDRFTTRRVEFVGNNSTRDWVLRQRIIAGLQEGDLFTRQNLIRSLQKLNKLRVIHPTRLRDIVIELDRPGKLVDVIICVREKRRVTPSPFVTGKPLFNKAIPLGGR